MKARQAAWVLAVAIAMPSSQAIACGYHATLPDLAAAHPRSVEVAIAVHDALSRGELRALDPMPPALAYLRAARMLRDFQSQVPPLAAQGGGSVAVLLVDSGMWTRYRVSASGVEASVHVSGPDAGEPVIVTSEAVMRAVLDGTLQLPRAAKLGLLLAA